MTIIQLDPTEGTRYHPLQSQSHRGGCWLEGYIVVPAELEQKVYACSAHCDLVIDGGMLVDILPIALPQPTLEPTPEEDRDAMLADLAYRTTLLEMGVT